MRECKVSDLVSEPADILVDARNAAIVIGKLRRPIPWKELQIGRYKRVPVTIGIALGRHKAITVVLKVGLEIGDYQKERGRAFSFKKRMTRPVMKSTR